MKRDEDEDLEGEESELKRSSRNLNEKKRRDRFNILVQQLAGIVSPEDERKLDKTTVLQHAITFLRSHQSRTRSVPETSRLTTTGWQPSFTSDGEFNLILLEALESVVLVIGWDGQIMFASQSVLPLLGYLPNELEGTTLFGYMEESDAVSIWSRLLSDVDHDEKTALTAEKNSFQFRLKCGRLFSKISLKVVDCKATVITKPVANREDHDPNSKLIVIVGKVEQPQPNRTVITSDCQHKQFSYRLTMDWKYVYLDHRASSIIGFVPFEVLGTSFYEYCSPDELFNIAQYQRILIRLGKVTTCYYRHLTKGQSWVWLQSCCYISYNQWNSKPESITCTATVVDFEEVCAKQAKTLQHDREHFKRIISRNGNGSVSPIGSWPSSPVSASDDHEMTKQQLPFEQQIAVESPARNQKENRRSIFMPQFLKSLMKTPSDQLMEILTTQSEVGFDSDNNEHLAWLENIKLPSSLTSVQLTTHQKLLEEYKKIAEQLRKQERQLKMIRKLIQWSSLLLEVGSNFGLAGGSSVDSEASSTSNYS